MNYPRAGIVHDTGQTINEGTIPYERTVALSIILLCFLSLSSRFFMTERVPFMMDELVDTQIACQIDQGARLYSTYHWIRTPLMNYAIAASGACGTESFPTAVSARKLMWLFTVIIFILTFLIARQVHGSAHAFLAVLLLASFTTFLDRSFRVRADLVSTLLSLPVLWVLVSPNLHPAFMVLAGLFLGLSVLATQKALYFIIAFGVALAGREAVIHGFTLNTLKQINQKIALAALGLLVPIAFFAIWLSGTGQWERFVDIGFLHAAKAGLVSDTYKEMTQVYLKQTLVRNPAVWGLGIAGIFLQILRRTHNRQDKVPEAEEREKRASSLSVSLWTLTLLLLILRHKIKFPYIFLNISPVLAICGSFSLYTLILWVNKRQGQWPGSISTGAFAAILLFLIIPPVIHHQKNLNTDPVLGNQHRIMTRVDSITDQGDAVFDGVGMAVTRKKATPYSMTFRWFMERGSGADYDVITSLKEYQPRVMIYNYRIKRLKNEKVFIENNFIPDWANVFVVGKRIYHEGPERSKKTVSLLSSAEYAVIAEDRERIRIDGKIPGPVIFLTAGDHELEIEGNSQEIQLKYFPAAQNPLPPEKPFKLYPSYR